jgi:hypothetical protein
MVVQVLQWTQGLQHRALPKGVSIIVNYFEEECVFHTLIFFYISVESITFFVILLRANPKKLNKNVKIFKE